MTQKSDVAIAPALAEVPALAAELEQIPIGNLKESPLNPRQTYDRAEMAQLVESIRTHGVLEPLRARTMGGGPHLLVSGHRRYRAAKEAGLSVVPVFLGKMTDAQYLELLTLGNLHRKDLHPLEEARGFELLIKELRYDVQRIAERVGHSTTHVYDRLKLLRLTKPLQDLFQEGHLTTAHAVILSRLDAASQARALGSAKDQWRSSAIFTSETLRGHEPLALESRGADPWHGVKAVSARELQAWVDNHVHFNPAAEDLANLFPETQRVLAAASTGDMKVVQITHEHYVQPDARQGKIIGPRSWKRADGQLTSKECEHSVVGVIAAGPGRGEAFRVCIAKKSCAIHWRQEKAEAARRQADREKHGGATVSQREKEKESQERQRREAQRAAEEQYRKSLERARPAIVKAIYDVIAKAPVGMTSTAAKLVLQRCSHYGANRPKLAKAGQGADDVVRLAALQILLSAANNSWSLLRDGGKQLKEFGIDVRAIADAVTPAPAQKVKAAKKAKPGAKARPGAKAKKAAAPARKKAAKKAAPKRGRGAR
jgi:ParB/RepB/Spo0J family partition protein